MVRLCLIGPVDKRVILYPLLKLLDLTGKTLVVTDDGNLRRLADNYESDFTIGRTDIKVSPVVEEFIQKNVKPIKVNDDESVEVNVCESGYDFVVYNTTNTLIEDVDLIVYCHSLNKGICTPDVLDCLESKEYKDITITSSVIKDKGILKMVVDKNSISYIWGCEECKMFLECTNSKLAGDIAFLFSDVLGISKGNITKTLGRRD